jgi:hypothetical protein
MLYHIWKTTPLLQLLFDLLERVRVKNAKYYAVDEIAHRRIVYHGYHKDFLEQLRPHYHKSKKIYLDRPFSLLSFKNIVRPICKTHEVPYQKHMLYCSSGYSIVHEVHYSRPNVDGASSEHQQNNDTDIDKGAEKVNA